jgi:hypothetical protein
MRCKSFGQLICLALISIKLQSQLKYERPDLITGTCALDGIKSGCISAQQLREVMNKDSASKHIYQQISSKKCLEVVVKADNLPVS